LNKIKNLSAYDEKQYILEDGVHTLALGHYEIKIEKAEFFKEILKIKRTLRKPLTKNQHVLGGMLQIQPAFQAGLL
jgi:hypothetical protein